MNTEDAQPGSSHTVHSALQQWSEKWKASVDVTSIDQICPDSRLTVVRIEGNPEVPLSMEVIHTNKTLIFSVFVTDSFTCTRTTISA